MTPCEKLGYKVGDLFEVVLYSDWFPKGSVVKLILDDHSNQPLFEQVSGVKQDDGKWFEVLYKVQPLYIIEENE